MNITLPTINITDVPMGNFTINTLQTECVYPQYGLIFIVNLIALSIIVFRLNDQIRKKITFKDDYVFKMLDYALSDEFYYKLVFNLNLFFALYTFLYIPILLPLLS